MMKSSNFFSREDEKFGFGCMKCIWNGSKMSKKKCQVHCWLFKSGGQNEDPSSVCKFRSCQHRDETPIPRPTTATSTESTRESPLLIPSPLGLLFCQLNFSCFKTIIVSWLKLEGERLDTSRHIPSLKQGPVTIRRMHEWVAEWMNEAWKETSNGTATVHPQSSIRSHSRPTLVLN